MSNLAILSLERNESWSKAQAKARAATCIIHVSNPDSFVSIGASISQGTGTLVDASRGIVLTCRRVIGNGPSLGHAVFGTKEYRIERLYSDPVHDFAFVKLLTKNGQIPEDLPEGINLHPEQAYQGCKICTVSNPGGQESNIGQGYISRTNSNVREWDFDECNTELMTAAMNCEGGSIGCSAINIQGNGLGIMIGFEGTVINLLPVDLPRKALERLQDYAPVNRGTLQVKWELKPLYECDRLQLGQEWLSRFEDERVEYLGLAVVRRGTFSMFDEVTITINGRINVSASVGFLHPALDLAVLKFGPVGIANAFMSDPALTDNPLRQGDTVYHAPFGLSGNIINKTQVENIDEDSAYRFHDDTSPFTAFSCTTCHLRIPPKTYQTEGILLNQDGTVAGLMLPSCAIIPSALIRDMIEHVRSGQVGKFIFRDFDVHRMLLADAFLQGLDRKWGEAITHKHVLCIGKVPIESPLRSSSMIKHPLRHGDIILKVEGLRVSTVSEVGFHYLKPVLSILLFRNGEEIEVEVPTLSLQDVTIDTVVSFCGSWLQKPPLATRMSGRPVHSQVYTTAFMKGGQADMFELKNGAFIVGVDGNTISTMADFVGHVAKIPFEKYFRVEFIPETQEHRVITMMKSVIGPTLLWRKLPSQNEEKVTVSVVDDEQWSQGWTLPRAKSERILLEPPKYWHGGFCDLSQRVSATKVATLKERSVWVVASAPEGGGGQDSAPLTCLAITSGDALAN
ncbi:hypothetical protein CABS01_16430 [Colletotrichum abscissum]|uniref:uncharacterized protein n=1 Tax=Colletotrichum abscissum TaxID=1671311 RepID=UPI0027D5C08F|nr:uncharacterized protein CABS01_16430 [Colletotrichum abscissum]KAK1471215.1 hypothetical protein CABS01_16430 [Colletotrichum abscissum]